MECAYNSQNSMSGHDQLTCRTSIVGGIAGNSKTIERHVMKSDQSSDNGAQHSANNSDNNSAENNASQRAPRFLEGNRQVSLAALREHIEAQFIEETRERPDILVDAEEASRRELIHDIVDYVLATSSLSLSRADKLTLLDTSYHDLFGFGTLDSY